MSTYVEIGNKREKLLEAVPNPPQQTDAEGFLDYVDTLSRSPSLSDLFPSKGLIKGKPQQVLYGFLHSCVSALNEGHYKGFRGNSCRTLVGCKGLGKTTALRNFTHAASTVFPDVITLFITCEGMDWNRSIVKTIEAALDFDNLPPLGKFDFAHTPIEKALEDGKSRLFVMLDEFDILYQQDPDKLAGVTKSISELAAIGNSVSGLISVVVSGSSAMLENLVRTNATEAMRLEFPALKGAVNLNGQKFKTFRVPSSLPMDKKAMSCIAEAYGIDPDLPALYTLMFAAGTNPRTAHDVMRKIGEDLMSMDADDNYSGQNTLKIPIMLQLYSAVMHKLVEKNRGILDKMITANHSLDMDWISSGDWARQFKPLSFADVENLWQKVEKDESKKDNTVVYDLNYCIFHLADRLWITLASVEDAHPKEIFPGTMLSLFKFSIRKHQASIESEKQAEWYETLGSFLRQKANNFVEKGADKLVEHMAQAALTGSLTFFK